MVLWVTVSQPLRGFRNSPALDRLSFRALSNELSLIQIGSPEKKIIYSSRNTLIILKITYIFKNPYPYIAGCAKMNEIWQDFVKCLREGIEKTDIIYGAADTAKECLKGREENFRLTVCGIGGGGHPPIDNGIQ